LIESQGRGRLKFELKRLGLRIFKIVVIRKGNHKSFLRKFHGDFFRIMEIYGELLTIIVSVYGFLKMVVNFGLIFSLIFWVFPNGNKN